MDALIHVFSQTAHLGCGVYPHSDNASCFIAARPRWVCVCFFGGCLMICCNSWKVVFMAQPAAVYPLICHNRWQPQHSRTPWKHQAVTNCHRDNDNPSPKMTDYLRIRDATNFLLLLTNTKNSCDWEKKGILMYYSTASVNKDAYRAKTHFLINRADPRLTCWL